MELQSFWRCLVGISNLFKVKLRCPRVSPICSIFFWGNPWNIHLWPPIWTKDDRCSTLKPGVTRLLIKTHKNAPDKFAVIFVSMFTSHLPPFSYWMTSFKRRLSSHLPSSWTSSPSLLPNVDPIAPTFAEDCFFQRKNRKVHHGSS